MTYVLKLKENDITWLFYSVSDMIKKLKHLDIPIIETMLKICMAYPKISKLEGNCTVWGFYIRYYNEWINQYAEMLNPETPIDDDDDQEYTLSHHGHSMRNLQSNNRDSHNIHNNIRNNNNNNNDNNNNGSYSNSPSSQHTASIVPPSPMRKDKNMIANYVNMRRQETVDTYDTETDREHSGNSSEDSTGNDDDDDDNEENQVSSPLQRTTRKSRINPKQIKTARDGKDSDMSSDNEADDDDDEKVAGERAEQQAPTVVHGAHARAGPGEVHADERVHHRAHGAAREREG